MVDHIDAEHEMRSRQLQEYVEGSVRCDLASSSIPQLEQNILDSVPSKASLCSEPLTGEFGSRRAHAVQNWLSIAGTISTLMSAQSTKGLLGFTAPFPNLSAPSRSELTVVDAKLLLYLTDILELVPSLSSVKSILWEKLHNLADEGLPVVRSILSFAATFMHTVTNDIRYENAAVTYRGLALQALERAMPEAKGEDLDGAITASLLLADQAAYRGDWQGNIIHHRGLAALRKHKLETQVTFSPRNIPPSSCCDKLQDQTEYIKATGDGLDCYMCLTKMQAHLESTLEAEVMCMHQEKANISVDPSRAALKILGEREMRFDAASSLGNILLLAGDVYHLLHNLPVEGTKISDYEARVLSSHISQCRKEGDNWLVNLPQQLVAQAFEGNVGPLVLLAFKFTLDLVLYYRSANLAGSSAMPSPSQIMAIAFLQYVFDTVSDVDKIDQCSYGDRKGFVECLTWSAWALGRALPSVSPDQFAIGIEDAGIDILAVPFPILQQDSLDC